MDTALESDMDMDGATMKNHSRMHMDMSMMMYFHFGVSEVILFEGWKTTTRGEMVASAMAVFVLAFLYEGLKMLRERHAAHSRQQQSTRLMVHNVVKPNSNTSLLRSSKPQRIRCMDKLVLTLYQLVSFSIAYLLMLVVMTYNIWLGTAVLIGDAVGFYVFFDYRPGNSAKQDDAEHCHG